MKILVIGPSWIGDMMMSQSLYRTLKAKYPDCKIDVIAPSWCYPLLLRMPEINEALVMPIGHGLLELRKRYFLGKKLRKHNYQRAYVLPGSFKSAFIPFFAGIKRRIGWRGEMRYGLLNDIRVLDKFSFPLMVERYVALAYDEINIRNACEIPQPLLRPRLLVQFREKINTAARFSLNDNKILIGFCLGAECGLTKRWPHYHYAILAKNLIRIGYRVVLFGSVKDHIIGEIIQQTLSKVDRSYCHNLAGKTSLEQAIILLAHCNAIVTNDSGLMHISAALDRPLIALYGPTTPDFTPPLSQRARVIRMIANHRKVRKLSADQGYHQSMIDIQPIHVMEELHILLNHAVQK